MKYKYNWNFGQTSDLGLWLSSAVFKKQVFEDACENKRPRSLLLTLLAGFSVLKGPRDVASNEGVALHQEANLFHQDNDSTSQGHLVHADYRKRYEQTEIDDIDEPERQIEES